MEKIKLVGNVSTRFEYELEINDKLADNLAMGRIEDEKATLNQLFLSQVWDYLEKQGVKGEPRILAYAFFNPETKKWGNTYYCNGGVVEE